MRHSHICSRRVPSALAGVSETAITGIPAGPILPRGSTVVHLQERKRERSPHPDGDEDRTDARSTGRSVDSLLPPLIPVKSMQISTWGTLW